MYTCVYAWEGQQSMSSSIVLHLILNKGLIFSKTGSLIKPRACPLD